MIMIMIMIIIMIIIITMIIIMIIIIMVIIIKEPMWKRRLQNQIKELRKDLSQLEASKDRDISNFRH